MRFQTFKDLQTTFTNLEEGHHPIIWVRLKMEQEGQTVGFGPCFHLPGQPILEFRLFEPQPFAFKQPGFDTSQHRLPEVSNASGSGLPLKAEARSLWAEQKPTWQSHTTSFKRGWSRGWFRVGLGWV